MGFVPHKSSNHCHFNFNFHYQYTKKYQILLSLIFSTNIFIHTRTHPRSRTHLQISSSPSSSSSTKNPYLSFPLFLSHTDEDYSRTSSISIAAASTYLPILPSVSIIIFDLPVVVRFNLLIYADLVSYSIDINFAVFVIILIWTVGASVNEYCLVWKCQEYRRGLNNSLMVHQRILIHFLPMDFGLRIVATLATISSRRYSILFVFFIVLFICFLV